MVVWIGYFETHNHQTFKIKKSPSQTVTCNKGTNISRLNTSIKVTLAGIAIIGDITP